MNASEFDVVQVSKLSLRYRLWTALCVAVAGTPLPWVVVHGIQDVAEHGLLSVSTAMFLAMLPVLGFCLWRLYKHEERKEVGPRTVAIAMHYPWTPQAYALLVQRLRERIGEPLRYEVLREVAGCHVNTTTGAVPNEVPLRYGLQIGHLH